MASRDYPIVWGTVKYRGNIYRMTKGDVITNMPDEHAQELIATGNLNPPIKAPSPDDGAPPNNSPEETELPEINMGVEIEVGLEL